MRKITFRGYSEEWGWVYGDYQEPVGMYPPQICPRKSTVDYDEFEGIAVMSETVGQYTGLTDNNGVKIFEGDIVQLLFFEHGTALGIVKYGRYTDVDSLDDYDYLGWYIDIQESCISILSPQSDNMQIKIVGNIYDNPELLKAELLEAENDR